ncbi:alpha-galactosidase [Maribellus sediminis]|uniref:alpha-galactosidase n=1 Tax=Maribellus sediminis TaxID=2696285 RepID=UPI0014322F35|nr:alpha-galactosidase [Maribellus sediminis]
MKRLLLMLVCALFFAGLQAQDVIIPISTKDNLMLLQTSREGRLNTVYFGEPLQNEAEYKEVADRFNFRDNNAGIYNATYTTSGTWNLVEPAIEVVQSDGNTSLELKYVSHTQEKTDDNATLTVINLEDAQYHFNVKLFYKAWTAENVIEQWTEIEHNQKKAVVLKKFASANLFFTGNDFYLTTYGNEWAKEMQRNEENLTRGIKSIDSKLGTRAHLLQSPNFILSFDSKAAENTGTVVLGQLAWSSNFRYDFEIDSHDNLRFNAGINPFASEYTLQPGESFKTPSLVYVVSHKGTGEASRNLHSWARDYRVLDGNGERLTLLNNWEATYFDFDENKITALFKDAKSLGVDLFLLDDGWFANKYPRNSDRAGLGDWQENKAKLPNGIGHLVSEATKEGIKFGIWIEPEMVNPKSELYENHIDWVIRQPERPEKYFRNQLVLDLSNPEVQDFVFGIVDKLFTDSPELAFIKWDCNSVIYNAHSAYLEKKNIPQTHLYIEYTKGLYKVMERVREKYPDVPIMMCSGGGGRGDYELFKYFTEFWPSDDTDPLERVFMQWNYSYFFPSIVTDCHVTDWSNLPLKYRVDVASMGKLGFDIVAHELSEKDLQFAQEAVQNYNSFKNIVWHGDLFRLVNPYENNFAALMYVNNDKSRAVVFNYLVNFRYMQTASMLPVKFAGLDATKKYTVKELNVYPGNRSRIDSEKTYSGDFLMKVGFNPNINKWNMSVVLEVNEVED